MGGAFRTNRGKSNEYTLLMRKPEGRMPLGRPRHKWVDNNVGLLKLQWGDVD
jgi:hypothetical protein